METQNMRLLTPAEYKQLLLDMLIELDRLCNEYNLQYSLAYGTLLGAVRHKGFIPWDDDMDVMMPREDYDKLRNIIGSDNSMSSIRFIDKKTDSDYYYPFAKLCHKDTKLIESTFDHINNYGAYIDVFPMTRIPNEKKWNRYKKWKYMFLLTAYSHMESYVKRDKSLMSTVKSLVQKASHFINTEYLLDRLINSEEKLDEITKKKNINHQLGLLWDHAKFPSDIFEKQKKCMFEGYMFNCTSDPETVLTASYGDYKTLPKMESQKPSHFLKCYIKDEK